MKNKKIVSILLSLLAILTIFNMPINVSAASAPKEPVIDRAASELKGQFIIIFKASDYDGCQMICSTDNEFNSNVKTLTKERKKVKFSDNFSAISINDLNLGKKYYGKIRLYNLDNGEKIYTNWSKICSITTRKTNNPEVNISSEYKDAKALNGLWLCGKCGKFDGTGYNDTCKYVFNEGCKHYGNRDINEIKLSKPKNLRKINNYKQIKVKWSKVKNADGYYVKYSTSSSFKNAKGKTVTGETSTILKGLKANKKYYIKVKAFVKNNGTKKYGSYCSKITGTAKVTKPISVKVTPGKKKFTVSYKDIDGYYERYCIKYSTSKSFKNPKYVYTKNIKKTVKNLKSKKTYYVKVKAQYIDPISDKVVSTSSYSKTIKIKTK